MRFQVSKILLFFGMVLLMCHFSPIQGFAGDELYFNESGDLIFSTYDKKATSGVRYRTEGWVLKRYEDDIFAAGQQYVNLPKAGYLYMMEDPYHPGYVYSTFIIDGQKISQLIKNTSGVWESQLSKYGGYLYIDSIMTVLEDGVAQGGVDSAGNLYGECYNSYLGIRNARDWADGDKLYSYYGLKVKYPYKPVSRSYVVMTMEKKDKQLKEGAASSFKIGSNAPGKELYDISQGIPSGENLYLTGSADAFGYEINYQEIIGRAMAPVKVSTTYRLTWCDTKGYLHMEDQKVERWYYVISDFKTQKIKNVKVYSLASVTGKSECFSARMLGSYAGRFGYEHRGYGDGLENYISFTKGYEVDAGVVWIPSGNYQRPDIPDENQQYLANAVAKKGSVRSDLLKINGKVLLSDEWRAENGAVIHSYGSLPKYQIQKEDITIPKETLNQQGYRSYAELLYISGNEKRTVINQGLSKVTVHTPVVAGARVTAEKENNQCVEPTLRDIVVGDEFRVNFTSVGQHKKIPGYGNRSYIGYQKGGYIRFPFAVEVGGILYDKMEWIEVTKSSFSLKLPESVKEGEYQVDYVVAAYNLPSGWNQVGILLNYSQIEANTNLDAYGARGSFMVRVIGKMHELALEKEEQHFTAEEMPVEQKGTEEKGEEWKICAYADAVGDDEGEYIDMDISYYVMKETSQGYERIEVDVYEAEGEDFFGADLKMLQTYLCIPAEHAQQVRPGVYFYQDTYRLPKKIVIVKKGTDISELTIYSEEIIKNETLVVHMEVYAGDTGGRKLDYENAKNAKKGYCNMWRKEGYRTDKCEKWELRYGDVLVWDTTGLIQKSVQVIGTH